MTIDRGTWAILAKRLEQIEAAKLDYRACEPEERLEFDEHDQARIVKTVPFPILA